MKTRPSSQTVSPIRRKVALSLATAVAAVLGAQAHAASIQFGAPTTIAGDADVLNLGTLNYALDWANSNQTLNGVTFTGTNAAAPAGGNVARAA